MSRRVSRSGRIVTVLLVGLLVLSLPSGLTLAAALTAPSTATDTTPTVPPILNQTETPTDTATPTATPEDTPTDSPRGGVGNVSTPGRTLVVDDDVGTASADCDNASYVRIQAAIDEADPGDTVRVCAGTYLESVHLPTSNLTLRADGQAVIESLGEPAVRSNASGVTIRGFEIRARQGAEFAIVIGGSESLVRDNTVQAINGTGILLSDGRTPMTGTPDPAFGAATGSRVVNNTVTARDFRIWADADRTRIVMNTVSDLKTQTDSERRACDGQQCEGSNNSIVSSGNETIIRGNIVEYTNHPPTLWSPVGTGIHIGIEAEFGNHGSEHKKAGPTHNQANENRVVANSVTNAPSSGTYLARGVKGVDVRNNTFTGNLLGVVVWSNDAVIRNNTISRLGYGVPNDGVRIHGRALLLGNTISFYGTGVEINGYAVLRSNTIRNNIRNGIEFTGGPGHATSGAGTGRIVGNTITDNGQDGIEIAAGTDPTQIPIYRNRITNNSGLGIHNANTSVVVNATNNIWACGGPSSGSNPEPLADPVTGRLANGSGDAVSAGNESGVSNVHFDPFAELATCSTQSTPSPTPSPTLTPSPTPTAVDGPGGGGDTSGSGGAGSGGAGGDGEGGGGADNAATGDDDGTDNRDADDGDTGGDGGDTVTPPPTVTPTPTSTPTATLSPTPTVEPGFGVGTWIVGLLLGIGLLVRRRRTAADGENEP